MKRSSSILLIVAGFVAGVLSAPATARAAESYSSQLNRIATAIERCATILERAAR